MDVLVLGPGGIKGYQELGVMYYLEESCKLRSIHTLIGVSVGAIILLLYNVGFTIREILYLAVEQPNIVCIEELDILSAISNFRKHTGFFPNTKIRDTLHDSIMHKLGFIPTLKELYEVSNKELIVVSYNLTDEVVEYISHTEYPDISCLDAVLLSINIPIVFYTITMNDRIFIDGAFGDPYPILLKDNGRNNILGVYIDTECEIQDNVILYLYDIIHCLFINITKRNIKESSSKCKHMALRCNIIDTIGINVTIADKAKMFQYGYSIATRFDYSY